MANCLVARPAPLSEIKLGKKCSVAQLPHSVFLEGIVNRIFFKLEFKLDLLKNGVNPHSPPPLAMLFPHFMICTVSLHNENCALLQSKFRRGRGVENSVFCRGGLTILPLIVALFSVPKDDIFYQIYKLSLASREQNAGV